MKLKIGLWTLKNKINKSNRNRVMDTGNEGLVARREVGKGVGVEGEETEKYRPGGYKIVLGT